jgi:RNA polymerase sigma factor (TIGR02999 family)
LSNDQVFEDIYNELRSVAGAYMSREQNSPTLQPTALVNEAYIKLQRERNLAWSSRTHFLAIAARAMRQVLIDLARKRKAKKRAGVKVDITLSSLARTDQFHLDEFDEVHEALNKLGSIQPNGERQAMLIEYVWFGGMSFTEAADHLNISRRQAHRDWAFARTWLERVLSA